MKDTLDLQVRLKLNLFPGQQPSVQVEEVNLDWDTLSQPDTLKQADPDPGPSSGFFGPWFGFGSLSKGGGVASSVSCDGRVTG
ncbi:unnamed protein product [Amoebophrya sp. A25]|nr:unnamed protein product [Amoebophrya sp. A25]|eukprot:GSA25T00011262001.1